MVIPESPGTLQGPSELSLWKDTEQVEGPRHVDDGVPGLRLLA